MRKKRVKALLKVAREFFKQLPLDVQSNFKNYFRFIKRGYTQHIIDTNGKVL